MSIANLKLKFNSFFNKSSDGILDNQNCNPTILSKDLTILGEIKSNGVVEIEGSVKGIIKGRSIIIRENGLVEGTIIADSLNIKGKFKGDIRAKNIAILEGAEIMGTIEYESLLVEDGACLDAQFKIISN